MRIGDVGVEFTSRDERQKAIVTFTNGVTVAIRDNDIRYADGKGEFATYERDDKEVLVNCCQCKGVFGVDACPKREYPYLDWEKKWTTTDGYICDACAEVKRKAKELADAKATVAASAAT